MYVDYNQLPDTSRVWIYQANRTFTASELEQIELKAKSFVEQWTRHGESVQGSYTIKHGQFIIFAVDQAIVEVSGCSIDASVKVVKELQQLFNMDLLNKMNIAFKIDENINVVSMADFKKYADAGKITTDTVVFNNMIDTKKGVEELWEVPANKSWHKRYF